MIPRSMRFWLSAALTLPFAGCGGDAAPPEVVHLAAHYVPPAALVALADGGRAYEETFPIQAGAWHAEPAAGLWRAKAPWYGGPVPVLVGERASLVLGGDMALRPAAGHLPGDVRDPGTFALVALEDGDYVFARLSAGQTPPEGRVTALVSAGGRGARRANARASWRIAGGPLGGDGFVVRTDAPARVTVDVPADSELVFDSVCVGRRTQGKLALRVRLDGAVIAEIALEPSPHFAATTRRVALPAAGADGAELAFEVDGNAWSAIFAPRLAPVAPATPARPDIVLFLADTFRADNLALYGGRPGVTPALDAFAEQCLRVRQAWSPACWTLPSHASMFLGVDPPQHGATGPRFTPAGDLVSIAERLQAAGYRTAAVTDSLFVSRRFELDRGFEHFEEYTSRDLDRTLRRSRELLAQDDGRPLFLFVHTYRTHEPYEASAETRAELGDALGIGPTWEEMATQVNDELLRRAEAGDEQVRKLFKNGDLHELLTALGLDDPRFLAAIRALYLGGVRDLDRAFGGFVADLDARARDTWVVFTSDHGEAFGEHESIFHGFGVWEENLHIPLLIRGPGLAPRTLAHPATLIDLPQTLAEMAGIAPHPGWGGDSLLSLDRERAIFAFDCAQRGEPSGALLDGHLKVVFRPDADAVRAGEVSHAYDLADDPGERTDLGAIPRATTALERLAADALERMRAAAPPGMAELDATAIHRMQGMGYTGADED